MKAEELNIIEKYLTKDEIKEIIKEELHSKLRHDFKEMYVNTLFSSESEYNNNLVFAVFKEYVLENYSENLKEKALASLDKFELAHVLGHTWYRKECPDSVNKLEGMKIIIECFKENKENVFKKISQTFENLSEEEVYSNFNDMFNNQIYDWFVSKVSLNKEKE